MSGDKATRASPFASQLNAGNVMMLRAAWNYSLIEELRTFPHGKDDQIDALASGYNDLAEFKSDLSVWEELGK